MLGARAGDGPTTQTLFQIVSRGMPLTQNTADVNPNTD